MATHHPPEQGSSHEAGEPLFACDSCPMIGSEPELEAHLHAHIHLADGSLKEPADITCWGYMEVGGPAWEALTFHGVHPMTTVMQDVVDVLLPTLRGVSA